MTVWRVAWTVPSACVCAALLALGCPAPHASRGVARPAPAEVVADGEKESEPDAKVAEAERAVEKDAEEETVSVDDAAAQKSSGDRSFPAKRKKSGGKSKEEDLAGPPAPVEAPAPRAEDPARRSADSLAALDLSEAQRSALIAPRLEQAQRALLSRDFDKAIAEVRPALEVDSESVEATLLLARAYMEKGWLPKAQRILVIGTQSGRGADSARLWMMLGLVHERSGDAVAAARDAYARAAKLKPNYAKAWTNLGAAHLELGDYEEAVAALETALSIDSESVVALTNLGTAYRRRASQFGADRAKRNELVRKSESSYRAALAVDEAYAPAHFDLGLLYLDTDGLPGRQDEERLRLAVRHLREYERLTAAGAGESAGGPAVHEYLESAQQALDLVERAGRAQP